MMHPHRTDYVFASVFVSVVALFLAPAGAIAAPPVLTVPGAQTVNEGQALQFDVSAVDPDGQRVQLRATLLPVGAGFVDNRNNTGSFDWSPAKGDAGSHMSTFFADDTFGGTDTRSVAIEVVAVNTPPVLGPLPDRIIDPETMAILSIWATDDDGDPITITASGLPAYGEFTDYGSGSAGIVLAPPLAASGTSFRVTVAASDGAASDEASFLVTITGDAQAPPLADARAWTRPKQIHLWIGAPLQRFYFEPGAADPTEIDPSSLRVMAWDGAGSGGEAASSTKRVLTGADHDGNGRPEIRFDVAKSDLMAIFDNLTQPADGEITILARGLDGREHKATFIARVFPDRRRAIRRVGPNPLNPEAIVEIETERPGRLRVMVFDVHGRMVRVLAEETEAPAGSRTVRFDGHDARGRQLRAGRYFVRVESTQGLESTPLTILP